MSGAQSSEPVDVVAGQGEPSLIEMDRVLGDAVATVGNGAVVGLLVVGLVTLVLRVVPGLLGFVWAYFLRPKASWTKLKGDWAVVTGASAGIGAGFAKELAKRGLNVALLARSEEKMKILATELEGTYKIETAVLPFDFAAGTDADYAQLAQALAGKQVSVLINNVGVNVDFPHAFLDTSEEDRERMISVNIGATMKMTKLFAPAMAERKKGCIYFLSSAGGTWLPSSMLSVYGGTKAFMDTFAVALAGEMKSRGVSVHSVVPFHVKTAMAKVKKSVTAPYPDEFAAECLDQMSSGIRLNPHWAHGIVAAVIGLLPLETAVKIVQDSQVATRARALKKRAAAGKNL